MYVKLIKETFKNTWTRGIPGMYRPSWLGRSLPPLGAIHINTPPSLSFLYITITVRLLVACFFSAVSGSSYMCFLEWTQKRSLPRANGLHMGSVTTRSPSSMYEYACMYVCVQNTCVRVQNTRMRVFRFLYLHIDICLYVYVCVYLYKA